jgi:hypothetical protein
MWLASKPPRLFFECPLLWLNKKQIEDEGRRPSGNQHSLPAAAPYGCSPSSLHCLLQTQSISQTETLSDPAFPHYSGHRLLPPRQHTSSLILKKLFWLASLDQVEGQDPVSRLMIADTITAMPSLFGSRAVSPFGPLQFFDFSRY